MRPIHSTFGLIFALLLIPAARGQDAKIRSAPFAIPGSIFTSALSLNNSA
jgi:hypothetical protein